MCTCIHTHTCAHMDTTPTQGESFINQYNVIPVSPKNAIMSAK